MPSPALATWRTERSDRLDELMSAHERIGGTGVGRRTETEQINWALTLRLAGEFQGFVRDLHALGVQTFAALAAPANPQLRSVIATLLTQGLKLDTGNATPGAVGDAFNRFGLRWWPALEVRDARSARRQKKLDQLVRARNAISHGRLNELETLRLEGSPMILATVRVWRSALTALAATMDQELAAHLGTFFSTEAPWH